MTRRTAHGSRKEPATDLSVDEALRMLRFIGENEEMRARIAGVIASLPEDVARFALDLCAFVCLDRGLLSLTVPASSGAEWLIVLDRLRIRDVRRIITHEIALAWLAHNGCSLDDDQSADILLSAWYAPKLSARSNRRPGPCKDYPVSDAPAWFLPRDRDINLPGGVI